MTNYFPPFSHAYADPPRREGNILFSRGALADRLTGRLEAACSASGVGNVVAWAHLGQDVSVTARARRVIFSAAPVVNLRVQVYAHLPPSYSQGDCTAQMVIWRQGGAEVAHPVVELDYRWTVLFTQETDPSRKTSTAALRAVVDRDPTAENELWHMAIALQTHVFAGVGLASASADCALTRMTVDEEL